MSLRNTVRPVFLALVSVSVIAGAWLASPAVVAHASPGSGPVRVSNAKVLSQKATLAYWTPARLRAAKPGDIIVAGAQPHVQPAAATHPGTPSRVAGGLPDGAGLAAASHIAALSPQDYTYPYPYDSFKVPSKLWHTYPYEVDGKLFFTNNGSSFVCSATSAPSASGTSDENEIWTAGHCLADNGIVDSSAMFIPAYNGNVSNFDPFGEFVWTGNGETTTAWLDNGDLTEDEAAMTVDTSSTTGLTLGQAVGWDGFAWNYPVDEQFIAFGYPQASPYNGKNMIEDIASTAGQDSISGADSTEPIVIGNPMTGGSSGGAWDISWTDTGPGYINGHNDYKYTSQPLAMYSPYQDTLSNEVRCFGASSC